MLVTVRELAAYMDRQLTNRQQDAAELVLAGLQAEIEAYVNRPVEVREFTESHIVPEDTLYINTEAYFYDRSLDTTNANIRVLMPTYTIHLANSPVVSVSEVILHPFGYPTPSPVTFNEGQQYLVRKFGIDLYSVWAGDRIEITYEAGIPENAFVKQVMLRAAAREMQNMTDDVVGLKDFQNRAATIAEIGLTQTEKQGLDRLRRKKV
jgi:hypothetical protein